MSFLKQTYLIISLLGVGLFVQDAVAAPFDLKWYALDEVSSGVGAAGVPLSESIVYKNLPEEIDYGTFSYAELSKRADMLIALSNGEPVDNARLAFQEEELSGSFNLDSYVASKQTPLNNTGEVSGQPNLCDGLWVSHEVALTLASLPALDAMPLEQTEQQFGACIRTLDISHENRTDYMWGRYRLSVIGRALQAQVSLDQVEHYFESRTTVVYIPHWELLSPDGLDVWVDGQPVASKIISNQASTGAWVLLNLSPGQVYQIRLEALGYAPREIFVDRVNTKHALIVMGTEPAVTGAISDHEQVKLVTLNLEPVAPSNVFHYDLGQSRFLPFAMSTIKLKNVGTPSVFDVLSRRPFFWYRGQKARAYHLKSHLALLEEAYAEKVSDRVMVVVRSDEAHEPIITRFSSQGGRIQVVPTGIFRAPGDMKAYVIEPKEGEYWIDDKIVTTLSGYDVLITP